MTLSTVARIRDGAYSHISAIVVGSTPAEAEPGEEAQTTSGPHRSHADRGDREGAVPQRADNRNRFAAIDIAQHSEQERAEHEADEER